jgi:hypothetical protein
LLHTPSSEITTPNTKATPELEVSFRDAARERERFENALRILEDSLDPGLKIGVARSRHHAWNEVIQAAANARDDCYEKKGFGSKMGRMMTNSAEAVLKWSELMPSQNEYFSVICGGLKLIFGVCPCRLKNMC